MSESGRVGSGSTSASASRRLVPQPRFATWAYGGVSGESALANPLVLAAFATVSVNEYFGHYDRPDLGVWQLT